MPDPDEETVFLAAMAKRYVWDQSIEQALAYPDRIVFRVMDLGTIDDVLRLEPVLGRDRLSTLLRAAPAGALRPRSWWFWHYRTPSHASRARSAGDTSPDLRVARYGILPEAQRALLSPLAPLKDLGFALYGGTAIAMQIGHRVSIDFDLFSDRSVARSEVIETLPFLRNSETLQDEANTWTVQTAATSGQAGVKLSLFTNLGFGRVGTPALDERGDLLLASLDDLLGHKLGVLL